MSSPADRSLMQMLLGEAADFFRWFLEGLGTGPVQRGALEELGINPNQFQDVTIAPQHLETIRQIKEFAALENPDIQRYLQALEDISALITAVEEIARIFESDFDGGLELLVSKLLNMGTLNYMRLRYPALYYWAQPLNFVVESLAVHGGVRVQTPHIDFGQLLEFIIDPRKIFKAVFGPSWPPRSEEDARFLSDTLLLSLGLGVAFFTKNVLERSDLLDEATTELRGDVLYGWEPLPRPPGEAQPELESVADRFLSFALVGRQDELAAGAGEEVALNVTMAFVPEVHGKRGFYLALGGADRGFMILGSDWRLDWEVSTATAVDMLIWDDRLEIGGPSDFSMKVQVTQRQESGLPYVLSTGLGPRLELGRLSIEMDFSSVRARTRFMARESAIVIASSEADGFVASSLPAKETRIPFELGLGYDPQRKFYLEGGNGLAATIPLGKQLGPVGLQSISLGLGPATEDGQGTAFTAAAALSVKLGPFTATVDGIGYQVVFQEEEGEDNFFKNLDAGFKSPEGIGLVLDTSRVVGGGYLFFDADKHEYAGAIQLEIDKKISLKAVGILTTRLPDGQRGFSLLIIVTAEGFKPLNIGFGFVLTGVGGLIGANRMADMDVLRAGLKQKTLDAVLFPENPVRDAPRIISNLRSVFPPREGRHLFGLMAQISWGTADILTIELALILEFPSPFRLIILGQMRAALPDKDNALILLNMDAAGEIKFDTGEVMIDATLYDSRLLSFNLTGDMALRASWENNPYFILAVGGLHPDYPPPPRFPSLERLTVSITKGSNPRVRLECYQALTANTVQFGARVDLFVGAGSFSIEGHLGFDALFQFLPFRFSARMRAGITLKWRGRTLFGVDLHMTLSGPVPWHIRGKATFKVWRFSKSVSFDREFGPDTLPPSIPPVNLRPLLLAALADPRNWSGQLPAGGRGLVTLREAAPGDGPLAHPLGDLSVSQRVLPLGIEISRFGSTIPAGERRFTITQVTLDGDPLAAPASVSEYFAAAQFLEMSDEAKLGRPSFEKMEAGLRFSPAGVSYGGQAPGSEALLAASDLDYETKIMDEDGQIVDQAPVYRPPAVLIAALASLGASAKSPLVYGGANRFRQGRGAVTPRVQIAETRFTIAGTDDLLPAPGDEFPGLPGEGTTFAAAAEILQQYLAKNPGQKQRLQIVGRFEVAQEGGG